MSARAAVTLPRRRSDNTPMPIGIPELIIILVIALLILGPGKLPEVGASLGKGIREFRKASSDIQESVKLDPTQPTSTQGSQAPVAAAPPAAAPPPAEVTAPSVPPETSPSEPVATSSASSADPATRAD